MPQDDKRATVPTMCVSENLVLQAIANLEEKGLRTHIKYIKEAFPGSTFLDVSRPRNTLEQQGFIRKINYQHFLTDTGKERVQKISTPKIAHAKEFFLA